VKLVAIAAILPLNLRLGTLNTYAKVGLTTLIGLITKHGSPLVEFVNQSREVNDPTRAAAQSSPRRGSRCIRF
jgi:multidrug efflux pump subunit AcrB